jgi:hypothetical protein
MKWQSYQSWLDDQSYLLDEAPDSSDETDLSPDYYHDILDLAERIGRFLELHPSDLEQFTVLTAKDTRIIEELNKYCEVCERHDPFFSAVIRSEIVENGSCLFPERSILYLSDISENRAAEKAAQLLVAKLEPGFSLFGEQTDRREIFYRLVLWEAIAYFGSKIINPKRKCDRYRDFERLLIALRRQRLRGRLREQKVVALHVLAHRAYELQRGAGDSKRGSPRRLYRLPARTFFRTASALGQILADRFYYMMMTDQVSKTGLRELFRPFEQGKHYGSERYWQLAKIVRREHSSRVSKEDRF